MTRPIDLDRFRHEYRRAARDVIAFVTRERQEVIARHNPGLEPSRTDLGTYLVASERRYVRAVGLFNRHLRVADTEPNALDVGGFLGAYPLTLVRLGVPVALAEVYAYYGGALDELAEFLAAEGVEVLDVDFTEPIEKPPQRRFSMVTNMAMLEHLAGSPRQLMENLHTAASGDGALVVEAPNIAYWPNRWNLLRGRSIHAPLEVVYGSASPYLGHHREYTVSDLTDLLRWSGFRTLAVETFNYSIDLSGSRLIDRIYPLLVQVVPTLILRGAREVIMALAVPNSHPSIA